MAERATDAELAERLASAAGAILMDLLQSSSLNGSALGQAGDEVANRFLMRELRAARPDDAILCEEEADNLDRLTFGRVWIVDPLDGTREFSERRDDWAVHVALSVDGVATIGAVALPASGVTLCANTPPALQPENVPLKIVVSRTRPPGEAVAVADAIGAQLLPMGSAGAKAMAVVQGVADIYIHSGGQYEWDNCAPVAVAEAAGLHVSRLDGAPLRYNNENPYLPDFLICRKALAPRIIGLLART